MSYTTVRDAVQAVVASVPNIGQVHGRERFADNWPRFLDLFKSTIATVDQIRGWMVTRERILQEVAESAFGKWVHHHDFVIRGVMSFADADDTETTFQTLVDAVVAKLESDSSLSGTAIVWGQEPVEVRAIDIRMFGSVMCHVAEIAVAVHTSDPYS